MKITFLHYHLLDQTINDMLECQLSSICADKNEVNLVCDFGAEGSMPIPNIKKFNSHLVGRLNNIQPGTEEEVLAEVKTLISEIVDDGILHFHNPNSGDNAILTTAIYDLAVEGCSCIYHIYDIPDKRNPKAIELSKYIFDHFQMPLNSVLYPVLPHLIYCCPTKEIAQQLRDDYGIPEEKIHLLSCKSPAEVKEKLQQIYTNFPKTYTNIEE